MSDYLDEKEFYEFCQLYRNSKDLADENSAAEMFESLKRYIRDHSGTQSSAGREPFDIKKTLAGDPVMATRTLWVRAYGNKDGDVRLAYSEHQYSDEFSSLGAGNGYWNWLEPAKPYEIG